MEKRLKVQTSRILIYSIVLHGKGFGRSVRSVWVWMTKYFSRRIWTLSNHDFELHLDISANI